MSALCKKIRHSDRSSTVGGHHDTLRFLTTPRATRVRNWLIVILACLAVACGLAFVKYRQIQAAIAFGNSFPEAMETVDVFVVREELWQPTTMVTGAVVAIRSVVLSNE